MRLLWWLQPKLNAIVLSIAVLLMVGALIFDGWRSFLCWCGSIFFLIVLDNFERIDKQRAELEEARRYEADPIHGDAQYVDDAPLRRNHF